MPDEARRARWPIALALLMVSVLGVVVSVMPLPISVSEVRFVLNLAHVPLFALWAGVLLEWWMRWRRPQGAMLACSVLAIIAALASEALQLMQPSRQIDVVDVFSNMAGCGLGLAAVRWRWRATFAAVPTDRRM